MRGDIFRLLQPVKKGRLCFLFSTRHIFCSCGTLETIAGGSDIRYDGCPTRLHDRGSAVFRKDHGLESACVLPRTLTHQVSCCTRLELSPAKSREPRGS